MTAIFQIRGKDSKLGEYIFVGADSKVTLDDKIHNEYKCLEGNAKKIFSPKGSNFFYSVIGSMDSVFTKYLLSELEEGDKSKEEILEIYDKIYSSSQAFGVTPPAFMGAVRDSKSLDSFVYGDERRFIEGENLITSGVGKQVLYNELKDVKYDSSFLDALNIGYDAMKKASDANPYVGGFMDFYVMNKDNVFCSKKRMPLEVEKRVSL